MGPTKAEAVEDLISVVNFDPTEGLAPVLVLCPDCEGTTGSAEDPEGGTCYCATCTGSGAITIVGWSLDKMTLSFRRNIQDISHDNKGRLKLTFRNKDKAAAELKALLGWDKPGAMGRAADGRTLTTAELETRQKDLETSVAALSKERIIADMMELAGSDMVSAAERLNILRTIAQMKGYINEAGETPPDAPNLADFYKQPYPPKPDLSEFGVAPPAAPTAAPNDNAPA